LPHNFWRAFCVIEGNRQQVHGRIVQERVVPVDENLSDYEAHDGDNQFFVD
jgi:hypothetical protein